MRKPFFFAILYICLAQACIAQIQWGRDTALLAGKTWQNYSTTYIGDEDENTKPILVTAIPYNGIYSHNDEIGSPFAMSNSGYMYSFRSYLSKNADKLYTYDSSEAYFITPGIHPNNADKYEFRVLLNGKTIITNWSGIKKFTDNSFQLNNFKKHVGYLGGYKTVWDNYLLVELRKKGANSILTSALVYWKQVKPKLLQIYKPNDIGELFTLLKETYNPYLPVIKDGEITKWEQDYTAAQLDPDTHLPKKLILQPGESNVVFYLASGIYKKEAIEYEVVKDGEVQTPWQPNDFDNSFIWLKKLGYGNYLLRLRYSAQRHNVTDYPFYIKPTWYQTMWFKIITSALVSVFCLLIFLTTRLIKQRRKTEMEQAKKNRLRLELKAIHAQLNPHFIFNSLSSIQGLINNNDIKGANSYLSEFGSLLRNSLTSSEKDFIALQTEAAVLDTYLKLERLRFGFQYNISIDAGINISETEIPALLLQPLVENAVKHGVSALQQNGLINIDIKKQDHNMVVTIQDNGHGFSNKQPSSGYGLKLTKERIALLNEVSGGQQILLDVFSGKPTGTTVKLTFKNWLA